MRIFWLAAFIVFAVGEAVTVGLVSVWFAVGALAALFATALGAGLWLQITVFLGVSALALMKRLGRRMRLYHINDRGTRVSGSSMTPILKSDSMELGYGNMDLESLIRQALSVSVDAVILESHKNWVDKSPIKSLQLSAKFLNHFVTESK